jgi:putative transposase
LLTLAGNTVLVQVLFTVGKKQERHGEAGLKVTYDTKSKEHKQAEEENRVLRKL